LGWARITVLWVGHRFNIILSMGSGWVQVEICGVGYGLSSCGLGQGWVQLYNLCRALIVTG